MRLTDKEKEIIKSLIWNELQYYQIQGLLDESIEEVDETTKEVMEYVKELNNILKKVSK